MTRADIEQFNKERDEAAKSYDVKKFRQFVFKWTILGAAFTPLPSDDHVVEIIMRKMVYNMKSATKEERQEAKKWLKEHGCTTKLCEA